MSRPEPPTSAPVHTRAPRGEFTARLSALLPDTPEAALPLRVLVARSGLPLNKVSAMLAHWKRRDKVGVVAGIRVTPSGRTKVWHYFRKVA